MTVRMESNHSSDGGKLSGSAVKRRRLKFAYIFITVVLALGCVSSVSAFVPQTSFRRKCLSIWQNNAVEKEDNDAEGDEPSKHNIFSNVKSATGKAASRIKELAQKRSSDALSAANATTSRLADMTEKGASGVKSAVGAASTGLSELAGKGSSDVRSAASLAASGLKNVAEKGTSDVQSAASFAASVAEKGTSDVRTVASTAASSLTGIAEKGASDVISVAGATTSRVKDLAKKTSNNAGEVVRWIDAQAKDGTEAVNARSKEFVLNFTGKKEYTFGDITKELLRRMASGEVNVQDTILLLKVLLAVGASFGPLAKILPVTVLLEALNVSLETRVGGKMLGVLAGAVDERFSAAFTADDKFQLGDVAKRSLAGAILNFTGKDSYEPGDIERAVAKEEVDQDNNLEKNMQKTFELRVDPEFEEWDRAFRENNPGVDLAIAESLDAGGDDSGVAITQKALDMRIASELEEWDEMFKAKYPDCGL